MNNQPKNTTSSILKSMPMALLKNIVHNWPWKLLSLFLAVCLWAGLITQDASLTREKAFTDVTVSYSGMDSLKRNSGLIVISGLTPDNLNVRMRAEVPQMQYSNVAASNYNPRIDLSKLSGTGEQKLKINTTTTTTYGSVTSIVPDTVTVVVDEYVTSYRVPVSANITGQVPEGFWGGNISLDPSTVNISGPRSVVDNIAHVYVDYDPSQLSPKAGIVKTACTMRFTDAQGNTLTSDLIEVSNTNTVLRSVTVSQSLYASKELSVSQMNLTAGSPAEGWRVKAVHVEPETVIAAGTGAGFESLTSLLTEALNISGIDSDFTGTVTLRRSGEVSYISTDTVTVHVEVEPVEITRLFDSIKISVKGLNPDLKATLSSRYTSVMLSGPQYIVSKMKNADLTVWVDASAVTEPGVCDLPVSMIIDSMDMSPITYSLTPDTVTATIKKQ